MLHIKQPNTLPTSKNQKLKTKTYFAFTLVELIVVIVILSILATIAFLSFNSYSSSSRDSVRLSDINSLNKSLELFNINASKYPDPTNVYTRVVYSGGVIFEQGNAGDSVLTAVQKVNKKPIDPLDNSEYTYSTNLLRTSFQLKGELENKLSTGFEQNGSSVIARNEAIHTSSFGAKGNGVEGIYENNNSTSLLDNVFNSLQIPAFTPGILLSGRAGMTDKINADSSTGSRICYVKGNFNGLIEKTNTGNTNYILAVPGLIVNEKNNLNLDYNTLSGKVVCNGMNSPCIVTYNPMPVFIGSGNSVPTTSEDIEDIMINLQSAYSGSNSSSTNPTISNLLNSTGTALVSLGSSVVSKVGVNSLSINSNVVVNNASCTLSGVTVNHGSSIPAYSEYFIIGTAGYDCPNRTITRTCNNGVLDGSGVYMYNSCVKGVVNNCSANSSYINNGHTYSIPALNHLSGATNILSSNVSENNGLFKYTLTNITCNDGSYASVTENATPSVVSCNSGYSQSGGSCVVDSNTVLLMHFDGDYNNYGTYTGIITNNGTSFTGGGMFGGQAVYFNGSSMISLKDSNDFNFSSGDFTIEAWVKFKSIQSGYNSIVTQWDYGTNQRSWELTYQQSTSLYRFLYSTGGTSLTYVGTHNINIVPTMNIWHHLAVARNSGNIDFYINGIKQGTTFNNPSNIFLNSNADITIGSSLNNNAPDGYFNGYMDELRISKGLARRTSNFTPPSSPY